MKLALVNDRRVICNYCNRDAELVTGNVIYPARADLVGRWFWRCVPCKAHVGTHKDSPRRAPLGRLANVELRRLRMSAHAAFDPLWRSKKMSRTEAYAWLAGAIGVSQQNCHIGMLDEDACRAVIAACASLADRGRSQCST